MAHMSIVQKMLTLAVVGIIGLLCSLLLGEWVVDHQITDTYAKRAKGIVQTAINVARHYNDQVVAGRLDLATAQERAKEAIRTMRYGDDNGDYVYVNGYDGTMYVHPLKPDWEGTNTRYIPDVDGRSIFDLVWAAVHKNGGDVVTYRFPRSAGGEPEVKVSYAAAFEPWDWMVVTGTYRTELRSVYWSYAGIYLLSILPLTLALAAATWLVSRNVARPIRHLAKITDRIRRRDFTTMVEGVERGDEVGLLARALVDLREASKEADDLRRQRDLTAKVFDASHEAIVITDPGGLVLAVNRAFESISGYSAQAVIGSNPSTWQSKHHDASFYAEMWATLEKTGRWDGEIWNRRADGALYIVRQTIYAVRDDAGTLVNYVAVQRDITEFRQQQDRIRYMAYHDPLTDLPNRTLLMDRLEHALPSAGRDGERVAVLFLDMDRFKVINDTLGHDIGDRILRQIAVRLRRVVRQADTVARMGGDEFVVMMEGLKGGEQITATLERILNGLADPFELPGSNVHCLPSIGVAVYPEDGADAVSLLKHADAAMYAAKSAGGNTFSFFSADLTEKAALRLDMETGLRHALAQAQFQLYYQPKVCMKSGRAVGAEALIRWVHPDKGVVAPSQFIPLAEETGLIGEIGQWVVEQACRTLANWPEELTRNMKIAVNVSAHQFRNEGFADTLDLTLARFGIAPRQIELELTESSVMNNPEVTIAALKGLRDRGFSVAVDDFGTGYSSLSYLKHLPIDVLKIDRAFVINAAEDEADAEIVRTIISLARALRLSTVAEGIETEDQLRVLRDSGCVLAQGYLFGRPMSASDFQAWVELHNTKVATTGVFRQTA